MIFLFFGKRTKRSLFYFQKKKRTSRITHARCCCVKMSSSGAATAAATLSGAFGVRTRGQKRRIGERDSFSLWEFGREVRRYLFHTYSSEIECERFEILVRSEYGDEEVG